jgi:hypothetical protein
MVLGHPEPAITKPLGVSGKVAGVAQRISSVAPLGNGSQIKD